MWDSGLLCSNTEKNLHFTSLYRYWCLPAFIAGFICWCLPGVQCRLHAAFIGVQMLVFTLSTVSDSCQLYWCTDFGDYLLLIVSIMSLLLVYRCWCLPSVDCWHHVTLLVYICWCLPSVDCWHHVTFIGVHMLVFTQC